MWVMWKQVNGSPFPSHFFSGLGLTETNSLLGLKNENEFKGHILGSPFAI
jgi:hypothetical protein